MAPAIVTIVVVAITLQLTESETEALRAVAEREDRSVQDVARDAIQRYVTSRERRRNEAIARIVDEDAVLLDRLAAGPGEA